VTPPGIPGWVRRTGALLTALALTLAVGASLVAQQPRNTFGFVSDNEYTPDGSENHPYDGRFQFVRLSYPYNLAGGFGRAGRVAPWAHDYPRGDAHYMEILTEITKVKGRIGGSNTFPLSAPDLTLHPFAYMSEPGFWRLTPEDTEGFRNYLLKGGFVMFDDFRGEDWENLRAQMRQVLPELRFIELTGKEAVWHAFFEIPDPLVLDAPYGGLPPSYWGLFEGNDVTKRMLAIANVNNDISEYWEYSDQGFVPVDLSNEAYKFGVNYAIYALTH
jgi:hypothetical protein